MKHVFPLLLFLFSIYYPSFSQSLESRRDLVERKVNIFTYRADLIVHKVQTPFDSLKQVNQLLSPKLDSLTHKIAEPKHKLDSLAFVLNRKIDSLQNLQLPYEKYTKVLDSLKQLSPLHQVEQAQQKVSEAQAKLQEKLNKPLGAVNEKLGQLSQEAGGQGNLPGDLTAPNLTQQNLTSSLPGTELKVPSVDSPLSTELLGKDLNLGEQISINPTTKLDQINPLKEIKMNEGGLGEVAKASSQVTKYSPDAKNISSGNIEQVSAVQTELASQLPAKEEVIVFREQQKALTQLESVHTSLRNKEEFKKQTLAKAKGLAAKQLAARNTQIQETVGKVSIYQKRAGGLLAKVKGLLKKRPEKEKQTPVIERFIPGFTLQVQRTELYLVDLNPSIRFKVLPMLSIGTGWNQRLVADKEGDFKPAFRVYGIRGFSEESVLKGFSARVDIERMNAFVPVSRQNPDAGERKWVWSCMAGMKKDFTFFPGVLGNIQFLYNVCDPEKISPYIKRFNVRFGFEFPLKEKKKNS